MKSQRLSLALAAAAAALAAASPALAKSGPGTVDANGNVYGAADQRPEWRGGPAAVPQPQAGYDAAAYDRARADWLAQCRRNHAGNGKTVGGAVLGGLVGGVVGNRVAGKGNRTTGTVVGAAVGAVAGGAIGSAADRNDARDYCERYLDHYMSQQQAGYGYGQPVAYGYAPMMVMVPVAMVPVATQQQNRDCTETVVTEEWVTVKVPVRRRYITTTPKPRPDKRVRVVQDKRVRI
jgi:Glycine zipper 2TM domain